jgi:hypothetical protein
MADANSIREPASVAAKLISFEPAITNEQCEVMGGNWNGFGVDFRIALVVLTKTQDELLAMFKKDPDTSGYMLERVMEAVKAMETGAELVENARNRLVWTLYASGHMDEEAEATA